jgi:surface polysaccharide O-acyltransferase-like enzyme
MTRKLRITLYVVAAYLAVFGILFVFAPGVFERITQTTLPDAKLTLLYGVHTLIFSFVAFMAAREKEAAGKLSLTILLVTAGNTVVFGYLLLTATEAFPQAGPPLIVNFVLTVLLFLFRKK